MAIATAEVDIFDNLTGLPGESRCIAAQSKFALPVFAEPI
jgi:hypothetical protein